MRILACGAHADDVELGCGGTLALATSSGHEVSILDLTAGELGSNGDPETRAAEAQRAAAILGVAARHNAGLPDGSLNAADPEQRDCMIRWMRRLAPDLLIIPVRGNRHPDHRQTHRLLADAAFLGGLKNYPSEGAARRPRAIYEYMERLPLIPSLVVRIDDVVEIKRKALACYGSQFTRGADSQPTLINSPSFLAQIDARDRYWGGLAGCGYGEPFLAAAPLLIEDPALLLPGRDPEQGPSDPDSLTLEDE